MCIRDRGEEPCDPSGCGIHRKVQHGGYPAGHLSLIHISEPTRLLSISYSVFCLIKKRRATRSTRVRSSAASDVYKRQRGRAMRSLRMRHPPQGAAWWLPSRPPVSYTHLRAHETPEHLVFRLLLDKKTASNEIYTRKIVGSVRCV